MTSVAIALGLAAFAAFFLWRVSVEKGWVGFRQPTSPLQVALLRFRWSVEHLEQLIADEFRPAFERAFRAIEALGEAWKREP